MLLVKVVSWIAMHRTCLCVVYPRNVVHAANDEVDTIWRPSQVVDLGTRRAAHMLYSPCLLVFERVFTECRLVVKFGWNPQQDIAIVSSRSQNLTCSKVRRRRLKWLGRCLPFGANRTTLTAWLCLLNVDKYSMLRSSPLSSIRQSCVYC